MRKSLFIVLLCAGFLLFFYPVSVWAVYNCGGHTDDCSCGAYNPFPCCSGIGNCTWWAWHKICCNWGEEAAKEIAYNWELPRHAKNWNNRAQNSSIFTVSNTPAPGTVAVQEANSGNDYYGHVAWVESVNGNEVTVTEMMWCVSFSGGYRTKTYDKSDFDGGYIYYNSQPVNEGWVEVSDLSVPSSVCFDQNFTVSFTLEETAGGQKHFEYVWVAIHRPDDSHLFDFETYTNVTVQPYGTWNKSTADQIFSGSDRPEGTYKVIIKARRPGIEEYIHLREQDITVSNCSADSDPGASCGSGKIYDCIGTCVNSATVYGWIGDGFCDDGNWGMDLRCSVFDCDSGDCGNVCGGSQNPGDNCGSGKVYDCIGSCVSSSTASNWIDDGYCDDGTWGMDLRCSAFNNDGNDCGGSSVPEPEPQRSITITEPDPGEKWRSDEEYRIKWTDQNISSSKHMKIEYSLDNGNSWRIIVDSTSNDGSKKWYFGDDYNICEDTSKGRIRITCVEYPGVSAISSKFTIDHKRGYPDCK